MLMEEHGDPLAGVGLSLARVRDVLARQLESLYIFLEADVELLSERRGTMRRRSLRYLR